MKKLICIIFFALFATSMLTVSVFARENEDPTNYPYQDKAGGIEDIWNFYSRYCTSYAAYRASLMQADFTNRMIGPNGVKGHFGPAKQWDDNARQIGFVTTKIPQKGSIIVWEAGDGDADPTNGHVGYVESVTDSDSITISEYNWIGPTGYYNARPVDLTRSGNPTFIIFNGEPVQDLSNSCKPPTSGDWVIDQDCEIKSDQNVNGNILVKSGYTLTLKNKPDTNIGSVINIDLNMHKIDIQNGGKIYIENGSAIK